MNNTKALLAAQIRKHRAELAEWHMKRVKEAPPPFYSSVDLRDSGFKIVPVDSNLFPAGFNNICPEDLRTAPPILRTHVEAELGHLGKPMPKRVLIIPESHTSNLYYIENLYYLHQLFKKAKFDVRIGWYGPKPEENPAGPIHLKSVTEKTLEAYPIEIKDGVLSAGDFVPDMILSNNDFSSGYPEALDAVKQPIVPSYVLGWHSRKKTEHFRFYNQLAAEFAAIIQVDPWLLQIDTEEVDQVDFNEDQGIERVEQSVRGILERTASAYQRHGIDHRPFAFIKNNSGTYGMGIMVVHSSDELRTMNRRTKNKMSVGKNKSKISSVAVQEGVPTATLVDRLPAEPVIYLFGGELVGGFLRTNAERGVEENLNSPGMVFRKLCMTDLRTALNPEEEMQEPELELVYGAIARISALATGLELARHRKRSTEG